MKICVTGQGAEPDSLVDPRFGRAAALLLVETDTREMSVLDGATGASHGAGVRASQSVISSGAEAVVTGEVGPKALEVLEAAGVNVYRATDMTVAEAVEAFAAGSLAQIVRAGGIPHEGARG